MSISAQDVKSLREKTGAGMMDCKRALVEVSGDLIQAERKLKEMGLSAAAKRSARATTEGRIFSVVNDSAAIIELSSETDFVARNIQFRELGERIVNHVAKGKLAKDSPEMTAWITEAISKIKENISLRRIKSMPIAPGDYVSHYVHGEGNIGVLVKLHSTDSAVVDIEKIKRVAFDLALHVAAMNPTFLCVEQVDMDYIAEQKSIFHKQAESLGKSPKVVEGIIKGRLRKHLQETCLLEQAFVKDQKVLVKELLSNLSTDIGAEIVITEYVYYKVGDDLGNLING